MGIPAVFLLFFQRVLKDSLPWQRRGVSQLLAVFYWYAI
jgi:hypothetical protein